ncbi:MAG: MGMT family protein [Chlorobiales bacterium]|nr:MGMT family protein [Chlorobiales bacterium]
MKNPQDLRRFPINENFFEQVYNLVRQIPFGKVSTYGSIAKALGSASSSRMVGYALTCAAGTEIPCHRVVNRFGALTGRLHFGSPNLMRQLLEAEGIGFKPDGTVDMEKHFHDFQKTEKLPR